MYFKWRRGLNNGTFFYKATRTCRRTLQLYSKIKELRKEDRSSLSLGGNLNRQ